MSVFQPAPAGVFCASVFYLAGFVLFHVFFVCVCTCFPVPAGGLACTCQVLFVLLDCFRFGFFCLTYCATTEFCFVLACFDSLGVQKPKQSSRLHWTSFERLGRITLSLWQYVHVCGL